MQEPANESNIEQETARTFDYMFSGDWMTPDVWVRQYKRKLDRLQKDKVIPENSKLVEIFEAAKKRNHWED